MSSSLLLLLSSSFTKAVHHAAHASLLPKAASCRALWQEDIPFITCRAASVSDDGDEPAQPIVFQENQLTTDKVREIRNDNELLETFIRDCDRVEKTGLSRESLISVIEARGAAKSHLLDLQNDQKPSKARESERVAEIDTGLGAEMNYLFDLNLFAERVAQLFVWTSDAKVRDEYMAPYFALIQCSGMGKTKLLKELRDNSTALVLREETTCKLIVCDGGQTPMPSVFDY